MGRIFTPLEAVGFCSRRLRHQAHYSFITTVPQLFIVFVFQQHSDQPSDDGTVQLGLEKPSGTPATAS